MIRFAAAFAALFAVVGAAHADDNVVVVELYTSQGCSSCPPADNLLGQIADRDDIIALAFHVDYWNYLGWHDDFSDPRFTARQQGYVQNGAINMKYTPHMVVQGQSHVVGSRSRNVADAINAALRQTSPVDVDLTRSGRTLRVSANGEGLPNGMVVHLVSFQPEATRDIRAGENRGRTLTYHNVVQDWQRLGTWSGSGTYQAEAQLSSDLPIAVLVQAPGQGAILGAAQLR